MERFVRFVGPLMYPTTNVFSLVSRLARRMQVEIIHTHTTHDTPTYETACFLHIIAHFSTRTMERANEAGHRQRKNVHPQTPHPPPRP